MGEYVYFKVGLQLSDDITASEMRERLEKALKRESKNLFLYDPLLQIHKGTVTVDYEDQDTWVVRVTRDLDEVWVDVQIKASSWERAKEKAVKMVKADEMKYLGPLEIDDYSIYVTSVDDEPEIVKEE